MSWLPKEWVSSLGGGGGAVASFNTRIGAVALTTGDVTGALGFTPQASGSYSLTSHNHSGVYQPAGSYAAAVHSHVIADVTGLQGALDGKQASGSYAAASHNHDASYALLGHVHTIANVTGLQAALDGKQASGSYSLTSHNHAGVYEPVIAAGTTAQYWRGDKTWQTLPSGGGAVRTIYRLIAAHTNNTVTPSTIGNAGGNVAWTHTMAVSKTYRVTIFATYQSVALTTGGRMNLLGAGGLAGTVAGMMWGGIAQAAAASTLEVPVWSFANGTGAFLLTTAVAPINSPHVWGADFVFHCTTAGTLSLQWASEVAASAAQLNIGCVMIVEEIE